MNERERERRRAAQSRYRRSAKGRAKQSEYRALTGRPDNARRVFAGGGYVCMAKTPEHAAELAAIMRLKVAELWAPLLEKQRADRAAMRIDADPASMFDPPDPANMFSLS